MPETRRRLTNCQNQRVKIRAKAFKANNKDEYLQQIEELEQYSYDSRANAKWMNKIVDEYSQRII